MGSVHKWAAVSCLSIQQRMFVLVSRKVGSLPLCSISFELHVVYLLVLSKVDVALNEGGVALSEVGIVLNEAYKTLAEVDVVLAEVGIAVVKQV